MKKTIQKHIDNQNYVKVYLRDSDGSYITNLNGFIIAQNAKHVLICTMHDFFYDGVSIVRKTDIDEIRRTENEKFFQKIVEKEGFKVEFLNRSLDLKIKLDTYEKMFESFHKLKIPVIIVAEYGKDDRFIIGPIKEFDDKKVKINYFNSRGEYDLKLTPCKYKEITYITIDSPYANTFYKYVKPVE